MLVAVFIILILLVIIGVPIILALAVVSFGGIIIIPELVSAMFPQKMFVMLDKFSLLAMPFFILAGSIMSRGGIGKRLVEFAEVAVGHLRGGLGHSSVLASMIFAGVTGSSVADTTAIGSILIPSMKKKGYKPGWAASLLASAGTIGPIIPPSMTMIVYGSMAGVSIGGLFLSGIIPGILIGLGLMVTIYVFSCLPNFPELRRTTGKFNLKRVLKLIPKVWTALLAPVIILGGILGGVFTATEAGVVACIYSFIISFLIYRSVSYKEIPKILLDAAVTTTTVVGIISVAGALGWLLAYLDFNEAVMTLLNSVSHNPLIVLMTLLGVMLLLTMFVEPLAILIIMVPVAVHVCKIYGFNPYYFGLLMVMATQIGAVTPPVAILLFVATSLAETTYDQTIRYCYPFILTLILTMLLVVFFPELASWIPNHFLGP
jgi:tripartite ATP-independent transporter DctM subunit